MTRLASVWHDLTEGHSLGALWLDFKREARSSFESSAPRTSASGVELGGWRRVWLFAQAMFFRLTPARRVLLLFAVLMLFSFRVGSGEQAQRDSAGGGLMVAAVCLLVLLALEVADRVAMKRDLEVARDIQNWLVPQSPPQLPGLDIAFATRPANTVAGDYYDVIPMPAGDEAKPSVLFVMADVAGKGIPAGLLMACFRSCLHTLAGTNRGLSDLMSRLNRSCFADSYGGRHFTTAFLAEYSTATGSIAYINAGHNPPLLRDASGSIARLEIGGLPCGTFPDATYEIGHLTLGPNALLLIYTDGVVEAVNDAGDEYGLDRLSAFVREATGASAGVQQRLFASIEAFAGQTPQHDDITSMVVQITG
jgi:serine phosphatase RsbU (regulator of sigma subunit)